MNVGKFKTVLCKHFIQHGSCSYGDKCQFAHGHHELHSGSIGVNLGGIPQMESTSKPNKVPPNPANFKIVKCKNWESTGNCKYGSVCTFAHGDNELRTKSENNLKISENAVNVDNNFNINNPYLMQDPAYLYSMFQQQLMGMNMGMGMGMGDNPMYMDNLQGYPGGVGMNNINLNDQNPNFFNNQMMPPQQIPQMPYGNDPNNYNYDTNQGINNMNMFMKQ
jgi:hypothetical protein